MLRFIQIVFVVLLTACSGTQLDRQMRAADMIGISANKAEKFWIELYRAEGTRAVEAAGRDVEARLAAVRRVHDRWAPVNLWWEVARRAHDAYATCLEAGLAADGGVCPDAEARRAAVDAAIYGFRCALRGVGHPEVDPLGQDIQCSGATALPSLGE